MSAVNKSGILNVNLCNFVPFVGSAGPLQGSQLTMLAVLVVVVSLCFLMSIRLLFECRMANDNFCWHFSAQCACVSLVVCQLSGTPSHVNDCGLGGSVAVVLVYSLSHDFAVKCLQNA